MKISDTYEEDQFYQALREVDPSYTEEVVAKLKKELREHLKVFYTIVGIAQELKENGYILGIISNHSKFWFDYFMERYQLEDIFSWNSIIIPSCLVHLDKPDVQIYQCTFDRVKLIDNTIKQNNIVFIDDKVRNTIPASQFGFKTIHFQSSTQSSTILREQLKQFNVKIY